MDTLSQSTHKPFHHGSNTWASTASVLFFCLFALAGCGGSGSGAKTTPNPPPNNNGGGDGGFVYKGTNPASTEDVLKFQNRLWVNIAPENRCGSCHGTQQPAFTRGDDINLAYSAVIDNGLVDLGNPSLSRLVTKVVSGHNCWQADPVACGDVITTWIASWAENAGAEPTAIILTPPPEKDVGSRKSFPEGTAGFEPIHNLLREYCAGCHAPESLTRQQPYFGSEDISIAYEAAKARIRLDNPAASRFVQRLATDFHNCWDNNCATSASIMLTAIENYAAGIDAIEVDEDLLGVMSKAVSLEDAFVLSSGGRVDTDLIAKYEFKTGSGAIAYDTSGVEPAANLNLVGNVGWSSAWGIRLADSGKAQASTSESRKIYNLIRGAGEYSIEAWIIPENVAQGENDNDPARIVSLSGSANERNFTLGQYESNYSFMNRTNRSDANGLDELATDEGVVASLQHVVATFDPLNGRQIYVNGELISDPDPEVGAALADWDSSYAFVLGNEVSNNRPWHGSVRFVGIHDRAMTAENILKNFEVGVGARYLLLFNVSTLINVPFSYVVFEVQQFDDYGYLFNQPFFTVLPDPQTGTTASVPGNINIQGIRIGINGAEAPVGQAFANLPPINISQASLADGAGRLYLSNLGTIIEAKEGPVIDEFFLTFDHIGENSSGRQDPIFPTTAEPSFASEEQPLLGVRTFDEINMTLSALTGIPHTTPAVATIFETVKQQLPTSPNIDGFLTAQQMGITQLTVAYCKALTSDSLRREAFFCPDSSPCFNFSAPATSFQTADREQVFNVLLARMLALEVDGELLEGQAVPASIHEHLTGLVSEMAGRNATTNDAVMASCAAAFGSAVMLLK